MKESIEEPSAKVTHITSDDNYKTEIMLCLFRKANNQKLGILRAEDTRETG